MQPTALPRILAIHDLSGFSHTSLMAVIPILSGMGVSVCALPTAILSSNTEQPGYQFIDLTSHLSGFTSHWQKLQLNFQAIYSGFLGSPAMLEIVLQTIDGFRNKSPLVVVDPVMGDEGTLYSCFDQEMIVSMRQLVSQADVITPNLTEAAMLLDQKYKPEATSGTVKSWCRQLSAMGPRWVIITSVAAKPHPVNQASRTAVVGYDARTDSFCRYSCTYLPVAYPGTGDIFSSVLTANLVNGISFCEAIRNSVRFVNKAIRITMAAGTPPAEGVQIQLALRYLT
jgi:pyridoxine kinase